MINNIVNVTEVISLVKGSVSEWGMPAKLLRLTKQAGVAVVLRIDKVTWGGGGGGGDTLAETDNLVCVAYVFFFSSAII
jgi:hypothetical protein